LEVGVRWLRIDFSEQATTTSDVTRITDAYDLGGIVPPLPPYNGSYDGPGPLISDSPLRTTDTFEDHATTTGDYDLDGNLYTLRLGLAFETPVNEKILLLFGGGVLGGMLSSDFGFAETVTLADGETLRQETSGSEEEFMYGAYANAGAAFYFSDHVSFNLNAQYNYMNDFSQTVAGRKVELNFKNTILVTAGLGFAF
jgi:hypothetical protein